MSPEATPTDEDCLRPLDQRRIDAVRARQRWHALAMAGVLGGLLLVACAAPTAQPGKPNSPATVPVSAAWWQDFHDPLLDQLVPQALQTNTRIRAAQATLQQARAARDISQAGATASLGLGASARLNELKATTGRDFTAGVDARWEADLFGRKSQGIAAVQAEAQAADADLRDVQVSIAAEVVLAYLQLRAAQQQETIARQNLASQENTLQLTQWRAQAGLVSSIEVDQSLTGVAQTAAQLPLLQATQHSASNSLAVLLGQRPGSLTAKLFKPSPLPQVPQPLPDVLAADVLRQRPDVRSAELRIQAALARMGEAQAARYPNFTLSGSLSLNALNLADLVSGSLARSVLGAWSLPIFDGGASEGRVRAQEATLERARADYQATVLRALQEVDDALSTLRQNQLRLVHLQTAASAAQRAAELAQQRYASGLIDFQTVLLTQRSVYGAQDSAVAQQATLSADRVRLVKALGGWPG